MKDCVIFGEGWSGEVYYFKSIGAYSIAFYWQVEGSDSTNLHEFKRWEDLDQYIDELDTEYRPADFIRVSIPDEQAAYEAEANGE